MCDILLHKPHLQPSAIDPSAHLPQLQSQATARDRIYQVLHSLHRMLPRLNRAATPSR